MLYMMAVTSHSVLFSAPTGQSTGKKKNRAMKKLTARPQLVSIHYLALKQTKQRNKLTNIIYGSCGTHTRTRARARYTRRRDTWTWTRGHTTAHDQRISRFVAFFLLLLFYFSLVYSLHFVALHNVRYTHVCIIMRV